MRIELPIFFLNDKTTELTEAGIQYNMKLDDILNMVFYEIGSIAPYPAGGEKYCRIYSNGGSFVCAKSMQEVDKLISKSILIYSKWKYI